MRSLYPEIEPFDQFELVDGAHRIYVEQCGNPLGIPVIFLHGGPGSGCNENHRRYFNTQKYRIVLFDQRGTGRSLPAAHLAQNTTQHIIADMEAIRQRLAIERWLVFGGSWGATIATLYAEIHPQRLAGLVLRGSFLARQQDMNWFLGGAQQVFPDEWEIFLGHFSATEQANLLPTLQQRISGDDDVAKLAAARAWSQWATQVVSYSMDEFEPSEESKEELINSVSIEVHFAVNNYFIEDNQILNDIEKIPNVPITIIHGRRDMTCLPESSWLLHCALPQSRLIMLRDAGHLASEPSMINALVLATDAMADTLNNL